MTWRKNKNHHTNYCAKWRNSSLGKTNPNHQYFSRLLKKETNDYLTSNKKYLLANEPEIYYSMKGQKLPKKYQDGRAKIRTFPDPLRTSSFLYILVEFWLPFTCLWLPFGSLLVPFGSLLVPWVLFWWSWRSIFRFWCPLASFSIFRFTTWMGS